VRRAPQALRPGTVVLETERLLFRAHTRGDLEAFCEIEADPEVRRFVGGRPRARGEAERRFRNQFLKPRPHRLRLWASALKSENRYIGYCGVYPHFGPGGPIAGEGSLGFTLARPYWGRGLATEAARGFVGFGFRELELTRVVASVEAGNAASIHILESLGFVLWRLEKIGARCLYHLELPNPSAREGVSSASGSRRR
jgi:[ribosomal protein S5]-alanine N-acetyltransferase